jgi:hypothetical protein
MSPAKRFSLVQWHVQWRTMYHDEKRPDYEGIHQRLDEHDAPLAATGCAVPRRAPFSAFLISTAF